MRQKNVCLHKYFENAGWQSKRILQGMDHADDFYMIRAAQVKLLRWTNGRALVLGDAAWAIFGVGTSLAIEGAYILEGELWKIQNSSEYSTGSGEVRGHSTNLPENGGASTRVPTNFIPTGGMGYTVQRHSVLVCEQNKGTQMFPGWFRE
jgi:hypothetical protein